MSDIITLAELKARLSEASTTLDTIFSTYISDVSEAVQKYLGTPLITPSAAVTVLLDGKDRQTLWLPNWPVLATPALVVLEDDVALTEGNDMDFVAYTEDGRLVRVDRGWAAGLQNISVTYKYGYAVADIPKPLKTVCYREIGRMWNELKTKSYDEISRSFENGSISVFDSGQFMKASIEAMRPYTRRCL